MDQMDQPFGFDRQEQIPASRAMDTKITDDESEHNEKIALSHVDRV